MNNDDNDYDGGGGGDDDDDDNNNNNNVKVFTMRLHENVYFILSSLLTVASVRIATTVIKAKDALVTVMGGTIHVIGI
jgi:hypothetical protein